jgi:hypothetical protein
MIRLPGFPKDTPVTIEFGPPAADAGQRQARGERRRRNDRWLQAPWDDFLPHGLGK